jgi:hypothetical protein
MNIVNLYAELQVHPHQVAIYRKIAAYYKSCNMMNEAEAFEELIRKGFHVNDPDFDQEQRQNHSEDAGID